jgi:hypothetical protein
MTRWSRRKGLIFQAGALALVLTFAINTVQSEAKATNGCKNAPDYAQRLVLVLVEAASQNLNGLECNLHTVLA